MTGCIAFTLNGTPRRLPPETRPGTTLLDWLRGPAGLHGTKEGCAEGDCGACTVVLEAADGARQPVNACLTLLGQLHGRSLRTVEGLIGESPGTPHPLQQAMAAADATQCGFCTPGIVMAAWAHARQGGDAHEALAGNLCRCTGYRPILAVFAALPADPVPALPPAPPAAAADAEFAGGGQVFHAPASLDAALALRAAHPQAWLLAGGTDLGLQVSAHRARPARLIGLGGVAALGGWSRSSDTLTVGAALPYAALLEALREAPELAPFAALLRRLGSRQIRGLGTLGGNLGTASPIGDALPPLLALGARVVLGSAARGERVLPLAGFLTGYRQNALAADELILRVEIPRPPAGAVLDCQKLSKRHDQDIATVGFAALLQVQDGRIATLRLAFGGMAASVARAPAAEAALLGQPVSEAAFAAAAAALAQDFAPLSDWRGSAAYRLRGARGLLLRLYWRLARPDLLAEAAQP